MNLVNENKEESNGIFDFMCGGGRNKNVVESDVKNNTIARDSNSGSNKDKDNCLIF